MQSAIYAVNNDGMTVTEASRVFGNPRQTLKDRVSCKYQRAGAGRLGELTEEEESALVNYVSEVHGRFWSSFNCCSNQGICIWYHV